MMTPRYDNVTPLRAASPGISDLAFEAQKALVNHEAEQALLGAILLDNRAYDAVSDFLSWEDFAHPLHGHIYAAAGSLIAGGQAATPISLNSFFSDDELLKTNGGAGYLASLVASAVTIINSYWYGKTIFDLARRREVVTAAEAAIIDAASPNPDRVVDAVIEQVEQRLYEIAEGGQQHAPRPLAEVASGIRQRVEQARQDGGVKVVNSGLQELDVILKGMAAGDLIILAGRPSMGKSALAGTITDNAARAGKNVMFFSLEMTGEQLGERWIAGRTGISTDNLRHGELDMMQWESFLAAQAEIAQLPITIDDRPRLSVAAMRQRARRQKRRGGLDLIVIDHLQLVRQGGWQESRRVEIGDVTGGLKAIAKQLGVPIILLSQLNRKVEDRDDKRPTLADLKESGDIEQDADVVLFLYRHAYYLERAEPRRRGNESKEAFSSRVADWTDDLSRCKATAEVAVAKNRNGKTGTATLGFLAERQRFENLAWEPRS